MKRIEIGSVEVLKRATERYASLQDKEIYQYGFTDGIAFANEVIEASEARKAPPKWTPKPGDKCVFWSSGSPICRFGTFSHRDINGFEPVENGLYYDHCALLESLDEIGKPPGYFISRGRCTVEKGGS